MQPLTVCGLHVTLPGCGSLCGDVGLEGGLVVGAEEEAALGLQRTSRTQAAGTE